MRTQITHLFGLKVYTDESVYVGEVEDVLLDVEGKKIESLIIGKVNNDLIDLKTYKGVKIPYRLIMSIADIVMIRHLQGAFREL